ncbi:5046_t:CDS:2 [Ambispora gerdemannii]|uniref:Elongation of fatty acids protein n=1 Tax=Ambispora gerdemannii TaxID=144530 RepID=A0A9N9CLB2_9GLOM|nr:5046_t:CDS:2 [Ambispora gerdemannii]
MSHNPYSIDSVPAPEGIPFPEYYPLFMDWRFPISVAAIYTLSILILNPKSSKVSRVVAQSKGIKQSGKSSKDSSAMTAFIFVHNLLLCVYSFSTFLGAGSAQLRNFLTHSNFTDAYCDRDGSFWNNALGYWGYLFYLSKYYEIVDTIIILLKGRRSSLLQTYHHAGAIITMWSGINYGATAVWIFVIFNSFIHTIMYAYYAATSIGLHPPGKQYLTTMQISQFLIGTSLAISYLFVDGCHASAGARMATWINVSYLFPLIYLFVDFAKKTYGKPSANGNGPLKKTR